MIPLGVILGVVAWCLGRYLVAGLYTVDQNERAVKTSFGRAQRLPKTTLEDPFAEYLRPEERSRYAYPQVRVIPPGGPYFKWPWERVYKVSVATQTMNMGFPSRVTAPSVLRSAAAKRPGPRSAPLPPSAPCTMPSI